MSDEQWRPIVGYEGYYEISDRGNVRSMARIVPSKRGQPLPLNSIEKSTHILSNGYVIVSLSKDGINKTCTVHRLVALAFIPNPDNLPEIDHIDRNSLNNTLSNLRWCSRKMNLANRAEFERPLGVTGERYIITTKTGNYQVNMNGICLGTRATLEEAITLRDSGVINHKPKIGKSNEQYISIQHNGTFTVRKKTNGNVIHYGTFKTIEEAIAVRNTIPGYIP